MSVIRHFFLFAFFSLSSLQVFSQNNDIQHIRDIYNNLNSQISSCSEEPDACNLYSNKLIINAQGDETHHWPATGNYKRELTFWYDAAPPHWDGNGKLALLKITVSENYAANKTYTEYLFEKGNLIFFYFKEFDVSEHRYYFKNSELIKYLEKVPENFEPEYTETDGTNILLRAEQLQKSIR